MSSTRKLFNKYMQAQLKLHLPEWTIGSIVSRDDWDQTDIITGVRASLKTHEGNVELGFTSEPGGIYATIRLQEGFPKAKDSSQSNFKLKCQGRYDLEIVTERKIKSYGMSGSLEIQQVSWTTMQVAVKALHLIGIATPHLNLNWKPKKPATVVPIPVDASMGSRVPKRIPNSARLKGPEGIHEWLKGQRVAETLKGTSNYDSILTHKDMQEWFYTCFINNLSPAKWAMEAGWQPTKAMLENYGNISLTKSMPLTFTFEPFPGYRIP
jgi:hypothetical protein